MQSRWLKVVGDTKADSEQSTSRSSLTFLTRFALKRLQKFHQVFLVLLAEIKFLELIVMIHHVKQCREPAIVIKAAFRVREQSAQRRSAIRVVGRTLRLKIIDADVCWFVRIPSGLSKQRWHMTLATRGFAFEQRFAASCRCCIETSSGWSGWRN